MKSESRQRLLAWRDELTYDLEKERETLPPLQAQHETAAVVARALAIECSDIKQEIDKLEVGPWYGKSKSEPTRVAEPLALRFGWLQQELAEAKLCEQRARCAVELAKLKIAKLDLSVRQTDWLMELADEKAAA